MITLFCLMIQVVAGGGAVEAALSVYLEYLATTLGSREQLAIAEFAEALLIIPKVLYYFHLLRKPGFFLGAARFSLGLIFLDRCLL